MADAKPTKADGVVATIEDSESSGGDNARYWLLGAAFVVELLLGGLSFGWSALSLMLRSEGIYSSECKPEDFKLGEDDKCDAQELRLSIIWIVGSASMNCGPAFTGALLDNLGPKVSATLGALLVAIGMGLYSISSPDLDMFGPAAAVVALGGITYHLACFQIGNLFPEHRGLVASLFVGGFTLSGQVYLALQAAYEAGASYRAVMGAWGVVLAACTAVVAAVFPRTSIRPGQQVRFSGPFLYVVEADGKLANRPTAAAPTVPSSAGGGGGGGDEGGGDGGGGGDAPPPPGPLTRIKMEETFMGQLLQPLTLGFMCFFMLSVLSFQFYVGTARLQLEAKGDDNHFYTKAVNVFISCGVIALPLNSWALDKRGYTTTLTLILTFGVGTALVQMIPNLEVQILNFLLWTLGRYMLYSCWFSMFLIMFGVKNFGKLIAVVAFATAALGLLQLPLTSVGVKMLDGERWWVLNLCQVGWLLPLYYYVWCMRGWEREEREAQEAIARWHESNKAAGNGV